MCLRSVPQIFTNVQTREVGSDRRNDAWSPGNVLVDTVARMQQDLADIRAENRLLRTPGVPPVVRTPRQAAFTTTKVPQFSGTTSWEQYRQVFDAIMLSNGWDDATAALQLLSHLEGDALNVVLLVPMSRRTSRTGLVDALGQTARLRLIRDRFIAEHSSCELRRYLDSVPPKTPIRVVVYRCRVWESHADPEIRRISKPSPDPIYVVGDSDYIGETIRVVAVTKPKSNPDQLADMLRRLVASMTAPVLVPAPVPEVPKVE